MNLGWTKHGPWTIHGPSAMNHEPFHDMCMDHGPWKDHILTKNISKQLSPAEKVLPIVLIRMDPTRCLWKSYGAL